HRLKRENQRCETVRAGTSGRAAEVGECCGNQGRSKRRQGQNRPCRHPTQPGNRRLAVELRSRRQGSESRRTARHAQRRRRACFGNLDLQMDTLSVEWERRPKSFLPPESPLAFAAPVLAKSKAPLRGEPARSLAARRVLIFASVVALTGFGARQMYNVVKVGGVSTLEWGLLALFVALFAWVAFSFMSALAGFFTTLFGASVGLAIETSAPLPSLSTRTAMLLPTYNEDPQAVAARWRAM